MIDERDLERVRSLWRYATGSEDGFRSPGTEVVDAPDHFAAPPGWVGIVQLLDAVVVASPSDHVDRLRAASARARSDQALTDLAVASAVFGPFAETLGPAALFYGRPPAGPSVHATIGPLDLADERVRAVMGGGTDDERDESDLDSTTSGVWLALDEAGDPAAACGWREWPERIAHTSVLTAEHHRGRGFAVAAARAALTAAVNDDLVPQWRAAVANPASIATARRLGLVELGRQLSVRLA